MSFYKDLIGKLKEKEYSARQLAKLKRDLAQIHKFKRIPTNIEIYLHCNKKEAKELRRKLLTKPTRTISGVAPVAVMTKPIKCPHGKCIMCPGGPKSEYGNVPQSYTGEEPAAMRGARNNYDAYLQIFNRLEQYLILGHNFEKVELIIMGGTFPSYPLEYQKSFVTDSYQAMNDFSKMFFKKNGEIDYLKFKKFFELPTDNLGSGERTEKLHQKILEVKKENRNSLEEEKKRNETAKVKCVALCIETRPDYGKLKEGNQMLKLGATRVEIGVQSVYENVLKEIQRGHYTKDTKESIRILKDLGFKVAAHYMPGLPKTNKNDDLQGMKELFRNPDYMPDMLKIYPCMVTKGTKLYDLWKKDQYKPLNTEEAAKIIAEFKPFVPEYCRVLRVQRDIPTKQTAAGVGMTNLRQYLHQKHHPKCRCIRCREPKGVDILSENVKIKTNEYEASHGKEFFISAEDIKQDIILGFLRLRFPSQQLRKEITSNSALIRELHVYGKATSLGKKGGVQHKGIGKKLMRIAEEIALKNDKNKVVVISGVGVRGYYQKLDYKLEGPYMVKCTQN